MTEKVRLIASNPLAAATDNIETAGMFSTIDKIETSKNQKNKELET